MSLQRPHSHPLQAHLEQLRQAGQWRTCPPVETAETGWPNVVVNGLAAVDFCANNYLGLAHHPAVTNACQQATKQAGTGGRASRLVSGTSPTTTLLETAVAQWKGTERALVFASGYQANVSVLPALASLDGPNTHFLMDKYNHASLVDGALLAHARHGSRWHRYSHNNMAQLESLLANIPTNSQKWIVTDSVFSMDGDCADLIGLASLSRRYDAHLLVDEAHGSGVFGNTGAGLAEHLGLKEEITLTMGTFSKALGSLGAYVAGPAPWIELLTNHGRGFIYSTALPPGVIAANQAALKIVQAEPQHRDQLWHNLNQLASWLRPILTAKGITTPSFLSPIVPVLLGERTMAVAEGLLQTGYFVQGIRPPTVPTGTERLRITVSAAHTPQQLEGLAATLDKLL